MGMSTRNSTVTGTNITWTGHADDLNGNLATTWQMISLGRKMGCDMSQETALALTAAHTGRSALKIMMVDIFFSLFSSPTKAFGNITGKLDIDASLEKGRRVRVLQSLPNDWFDGNLEIDIITEVPICHRPLIGLSSIVAQSADDADRLGKRLEAEAGLFCDPYD